MGVSSIAVVLLLLCGAQHAGAIQARLKNMYGAVLDYYPKDTYSNGTMTVVLRYKTGYTSCKDSVTLRCSHPSNARGRGCGSETQLEVYTVYNTTEWCQREAIMTRLVPSNSGFGMELISDNHNQWINNRQRQGYWHADMFVNLRTRSDTGKANRPPQTTIIPSLRVPSNCVRNFNLLAFDPDGDRVECHQSSSVLPSFLIISTNCTLSFAATNPKNEGAYVIPLKMSDHTTFTHGWTSFLHLQFVVKVDRAVPSCTEGQYLPRFLPPTPANREQLYTNVGHTLEITINTEATHSTVSELLFSGPHNMNLQAGSAQGQFILRWTPSQSEDGEHHPVCFVAQANGATKKAIYQSELRCVIVSVSNANTTTTPTTTQPSTTAQHTTTTKAATTTTPTGTKIITTTQNTTTSAATNTTPTITQINTTAQHTKKRLQKKTTKGATTTTPNITKIITTAQNTTMTTSPATTTTPTITQRNTTAQNTTMTTTAATTTTQTITQRNTTAQHTKKRLQKKKTKGATTTTPTRTKIISTAQNTTMTTSAATNTTPTITQRNTTAQHTKKILQKKKTKAATTTTPTITKIITTAQNTTMTTSPATNTTPTITQTNTTTQHTSDTTMTTTIATTITPTRTKIITTAQNTTMTTSAATTTPPTTTQTNTTAQHTTMAKAATTTTPTRTEIISTAQNTTMTTSAATTTTSTTTQPNTTAQHTTMAKAATTTTPTRTEIISTAQNTTMTTSAATTTTPTITQIITTGQNTSTTTAAATTIAARTERISTAQHTTTTTTAPTIPTTTTPTTGNFSESLKANVICNDTAMTVEIDKSSFKGHLRLNDPSNVACSLERQQNGTHIIAVVPLSGCGTEIEEDDENLIFKNAITSVDDVNDIISRKHLVEVDIYCQYPKTSNVTMSYTAHRCNVTVEEKGFGTFTYQFEFFHSQRFTSMIDPSSYPLEYDVGERIYMDIEASSSLSNTELFVESCSAAPYDNPSYRPTYSIIEHGCPVDRTVEVHSPRHDKHFQFSMETFKFIGLHDQVYISCSVIVCEAGNPNTRCSKGCINSTQSRHQRKREAVVQTARHYISQGPLRLRRSSEITATSLNLNLVFIAGCLLTAVAMICAVAIYKVKSTTRVKYELLPSTED